MKKLFLILFVLLFPALINAQVIDGGYIGGPSMANPGTIGSDATPATNIDATNIQVDATLGSELITWTAAGWNEDGATWTFAGGVLTHVTGNTTTVTGTVTGALTAGVTYRVTITGTGGTAKATYTLGGVTGTTIAASGAIAIEDYITAASDSELVITPANTCTVALTLVSVKALTDATGDLTVQGNLMAGSPIILNYGTKAYPPILFKNDNYSNIGLYSRSWMTLGVVENSKEIIQLSYNAVSIPSQLNMAAEGVDLSTTGTDVSLCRDAAQTLGQRNTTNQQKFSVYNTSDGGSTSNYERLAITGVQTASLNLTAETNGTGADNLDIVLTPVGTGQLKNTAANITAGATGTSVSLGHINRQVYVRTYAAADFTDSDTTKGIVIATLPAKTKIVGFYADSTATFKGGAVNAATLEVGITAEGAAEIMAAKDIWTATATYGLADADMGTGMTRAAQIQGGYLPSWTGTTAIYATIDTTAGNLNALTTGSVTFYIETERY